VCYPRGTLEYGVLPTELLQNTFRAGVVKPFALEQNAETLELARSTIELFSLHQGRSRRDLDEALEAETADSTDYRTRRGLAHLLYSECCEFSTQSRLEPAQARDQVFALAAQRRPSLASAAAVLEQVALRHTLTTAELEQSLYADLREAQQIALTAPTPEWLLERFNLAQAQGVLYRASELTVTAFRNNPGQYKLLFKYLKLFGLMHRINGDPDSGYTIALDGPSSLFTPSTRYGVAFAKFLPALLHVSKWTLTAKIQVRHYDGSKDEGEFVLDSSTTLKSHYSAGKMFDSLLEQSFSSRWAQFETKWRLEREVDLVDLGGTVMIPDFRLVHEDGRSVMLEIIGYWRAEYLERKLRKIQASERSDLILAVSQRLNLGKETALKLERYNNQIIWFKGVLEPKNVVRLAERLPAARVFPI
jgi:uncharacterized protein